MRAQHISWFANQWFKSFARTENNCFVRSLVLLRVNIYMFSSSWNTRMQASKQSMQTHTHILYFNILHVSKLSAPIYGVFIKHGLYLFFLSSFHSPCSLLNFAPYHFLTCHFYLVFSLSHCTVASSYQTLSIAITLHKIRRDIIITFFFCYT